MASNGSIVLARISQSTIRNASRPASLLRASRGFSTSQKLCEAPPLLVQIKADLKTAMRARDAPRLSVLRSVLSASNEAAKQDKEITTDVQVVKLLQKTASGIKQAIEEAKQASRDDVVEKEEAQIKIVDEYIAKANVDLLSEEEMKSILEARISELLASGTDAQSATKTLRGEAIAGTLVPEGKHIETGATFQILNPLLSKLRTSARQDSDKDGQ